MSSDFYRQNWVGYERGTDFADGAHKENAGEWNVFLAAELLDCDFLEFLVDDEINDRINYENQVSKHAFEKGTDTFLLEDLLDESYNTFLRI